MEARYIALFVLVYFLFFNGCATAPLKLETDGPKLAEIVGVDSSELKFLAYCKYAQSKGVYDEKYHRAAYRTASFTKGIALLTETHLIILKDGLREASTKDMMRFPLSDFSGVDLLPAAQIQLLMKDRDRVLVILVWPTEAIFSMAHVAEAERLYRLILAAGIPKWKHEADYNFPL